MQKKQDFKGKSWKRDFDDKRSIKINFKDKDPKNSHKVNKPAFKPTEHVELAKKIEPEVDKKSVMDNESPILEENEEDLKQMAITYLEETKQRLISKSELRKQNSAESISRPEEYFFSKLDSSLKKNTAFIKRLRNITETQRESLIKDMTNLNLTKYISEAAAALVEAKLKMADVSTAVQICSLLHQRYADFGQHLFDHWQKVLSFKKDERVSISNASKLRVDLRFYAELISSGVFTSKEGLPLLGNLLTVLTGSDKEDHNNLNIILSFCKHCGEDYAGLVPRKIRIQYEKYFMDAPKSDFLYPERQNRLRSILREYYKSLCKHVVTDHKSLQGMDHQNRRILETKGELSQERKEKWEMAQVNYQKLLQGMQQLADILDEEMPELPKEDTSQYEFENTTFEVFNRFKDGELDSSTSLWEDEDTRSFYENLPSLKALVPGILFKDSNQSQQSSEPEANHLEEDLQKLELDDVELLNDENNKQSGKQEPEEDIKDITEKLMGELEEEEMFTGTTTKAMLDSYFSNLLQCVNREMIDKAALTFCTNFNNKPNRKKLCKTLFLVPRTRLDLLPFYARFVAILHPCMHDIANDLVSMLKQDFKFHVKKKDQINIESKVKIVRFIGELVKFKMFPKSEALFFLKMLLLDFSHHHIEMACNLLETCGRFLFRSPESHQRTKVYLEQMMRRKAVRALDSRYITMIENAFYYCNPPEAPATARVERPPLHEYVRKLLYKDLTKNNTDKIMKQLRKLDWNDSEVNSYITKCLTACWNVKYFNIRYVANLLAGLVSYQEAIAPQVVDSVLEEIRLGMEINHPKYNQRRVSLTRYLGELYNYRVVESTVIFKVLYSFISFGVSYNGGIYTELDPPEHLFRIKLVCILLEACGQFFNSGLAKKMLDCFLVFFQYYFQIKKSNEMFNEENPFPITICFTVQDAIMMLRPKFKLATTLEESHQAVNKLLDELKLKIEECFSFDSHISQMGEVDNLGPIQEVEEEEEYPSDEEEDDDDPASLSNPHEGEEPEQLTSDPINFASLSEEDHDTANSIIFAPKHMNCTEDEDFMSALDMMMSESVVHRRQEAYKHHAELVIPLNIKVSKKIDDLKPPPEEKKTVNFVLMTRRGNKPHFKNLEVPFYAEIAQNLRDQKEAERIEKEQVKKLTLDINERQEEEDYQEMVATLQRPAVISLNRDRRLRYTHPKGAPDADLIFGNKKR